jgi:2,5-furandicarboxylate decarboxylase 1
MKRDPIFMDITPGRSSEHLLLGSVGRQARSFVRLKEMIPGLKAINFPRSGTLFHAYLSMRKMAEGEVRRALMLLFGLDPYLKLAIAVDDDIDVFDESEVMWAMATRFQADQDLFVVPKVLANQLDPSSSQGMTAKLGIDATAPIGWKEKRATISPEAAAAARTLLDGYLSGRGTTSA